MHLVKDLRLFWLILTIIMAYMGSKDVLITYLKKKRETLKMSQASFSEFLSIPLRTYKGYEYGESSVPLEVLDRISLKLNVSVSEMFASEPDAEAKNKISSRDLLELLASRLGFEADLKESTVNYGADLHRKISLLGDKELNLLNKTVDKMLVASLASKKAN